LQFSCLPPSSWENISGKPPAPWSHALGSPAPILLFSRQSTVLQFGGYMTIPLLKSLASSSLGSLNLR
jgi:hypothetical protein